MSKAFEGDRGFSKPEKPRKREVLTERRVLRATGETTGMFTSRVERNGRMMLEEQKNKILAETGMPAVGLQTIATFSDDLQEASVVVFRYLSGRG